MPQGTAVEGREAKAARQGHWVQEPHRDMIPHSRNTFLAQADCHRSAHGSWVRFSVLEALSLRSFLRADPEGHFERGNSGFGAGGRVAYHTCRLLRLREGWIPCRTVARLLPSQVWRNSTDCAHTVTGTQRPGVFGSVSGGRTVGWPGQAPPCSPPVCWSPSSLPNLHPSRLGPPS